MKKGMVCLFALLFIAACSKQSAHETPSASSEENIRITATFYPLYIMCLNIADGIKGADVSCLAPQGAGCLHDYSLTARDAAKIEECNILVANGAGIEPFLEKAVEEKGDALIIASKGYPLLDDNPHIWVSVEGARHEVRTIAAGLARLDDKRSAFYMDNAKIYDNKLELLKNEMHKTLSAFKGRSIVTFHEAFPYFASEFGFDVLAIIEHEGGTLPSAKEAAEAVRIIKDAIKNGHSPALFAQTQYPYASAKLIEAETGLSLHTLDPCVTGKMEKDAYIKAQKENAVSLAEALKE